MTYAARLITHDADRYLYAATQITYAAPGITQSTAHGGSFTPSCLRHSLCRGTSGRASPAQFAAKFQRSPRPDAEKSGECLETGAEQTTEDHLPLCLLQNMACLGPIERILGRAALSSTRFPCDFRNAQTAPSGKRRRTGHKDGGVTGDRNLTHRSRVSKSYHRRASGARHTHAHAPTIS